MSLAALTCAAASACVDTQQLDKVSANTNSSAHDVQQRRKRVILRYGARYVTVAASIGIALDFDHCRLEVFLSALYLRFSPPPFRHTFFALSEAVLSLSQQRKQCIQFQRDRSLFIELSQHLDNKSAL